MAFGVYKRKNSSWKFSESAILSYSYSRHEISFNTTLSFKVKKLFTFARRYRGIETPLCMFCSIFNLRMKEFNLIALLGFYILCPHNTVVAQGNSEVFAKKVIHLTGHQQVWGEKLSNIYYLNPKETLYTSADVAVKTAEPTAAIIFSESKPVIQNGKRFVRPKIPAA